MKQKSVFRCKKVWAVVLAFCVVLAAISPVSRAAADGTVSDGGSGTASDKPDGTVSDGGSDSASDKPDGTVSDGSGGTASDEGSGAATDEPGDSGSDEAPDKEPDGTGDAEGTFTVTTEEGTKVYPLAANPVTWNGKRYNEGILPQKMDDVWMVPVEHVLSAILDCDVSWNEAKDTLTVKSPSREYAIVLTLNSSEAQFAGAALSMPAFVRSGTLKPSGETEVFVPMEFVLDKLGFEVSVEDGEIYVYADDYIYYKNADTLDFDASIYENALESVFVREDGNKEYVRGITCQPVSKGSVSVRADVREYQVTIAFARTKNTVGEIDEKFTEGSIISLKVWETEEHTTCIAVTYDKKYIYSRKFLSDGAQITFSRGSFALKVILPDDVDYSDITTTDQYWKNRFLIIIPGNYVSFYKKYTPVKNKTSVKSVAVSKTAEGNTKLTVTTSGLKGYKLTKGSGFFTVAVGSPSSIYTNIVMLDAGHGGKDNGATGNGLKEKALNLKILYTYAKSYFEDPDSPVKAYWTRHDDTFINLYERPKYPKRYEADLFVSLHMNSASRRSANGTEVYYSKNNNKEAFAGLTSKIFATRMKNTLVDELGSKDRGVKQAGFVVAKYNTVPSILIELGFITGSSDHKKLARTAYQKKAAEVLYEGIVDTFEEYPTDR